MTANTSREDFDKSMGGFGSGEHRSEFRRRRLVEDTFVLDADVVCAGGPVLGGIGIDLGLRSAGMAGTLRIIYLARSDPDGIILSIKMPCWDGSAILMDVALEAVPFVFGGARHYFLCPGLSPSEWCGRRALKLYWPVSPPLGLACRVCHGLAYRSSQKRKGRPLWMRRHLAEARAAGFGPLFVR